MVCWRVGEQMYQWVLPSRSRADQLPPSRGPSPSQAQATTFDAGEYVVRNAKTGHYFKFSRPGDTTNVSARPCSHRVKPTS